jgi:hypothetical protein
MSETDTTTDTTSDTDAATATDTGETGKDWAAEAEKWKSLARKHEQQSKANADKARQYDELEEAQKSEQQKLIERAEKAERLAAEVEARAMRVEIAAEKGIPANLLSGTTREDLEASADALLAFRGEAAKPAPPDFGGGDRGTDVGTAVVQLTRDQLKSMTSDQIVEAKAAGQLDGLLKANS